MRLHIWALAALAGVGSLLAAAPARAQTDPKTVVATVNGRTITLAEVDAVIKARGPSAVALSEQQIKATRFDVVCMLIDGILWEQYLAKSGPRIDAAVVNKHMAELEQEVKKHGKTLAEYFKDSGQSESSVRAGILSMLQWEAIAQDKISEADARRYYDENKDYFDRILVHASHIVLKVSAKAPEADRQAAREKLLAIRAHIAAGTLDFAEAAKRYSQDATAPDGGDLGLFPLKLVMPDSIAKAAFALPVNGVSDVVATEYGLHLIKVTERKPPERPSEYEKVKPEVREICTAELQLAVMQQLRQAADVKITLPK
jgi:peptidyl-prolyl cis-trans isomerase C